MKKLFTIFGATGQQGGAIIQHFLQSPSLSSAYRLRGVTRDATKPAAVALKNKGVEILEADMNKPETLEAAMKDSQIVFAMTSYWETASAPTETAQGISLANAAVSAQVFQFIWSSLPAIGIPHFNSKAAVEDYIRSLSAIPYTAFFMPGWYMQNFATATRPRKVGDRKYVLDPIWPGANGKTRVPLIDIADAGKYVESVIRDAEAFNGKRLYAATAWYELDEICRIWGETMEVEILMEEGAGVGLPAGTELSYFGGEGEEGVEWTVMQVKGELTAWKEFVDREEMRLE